MKFAKLAVAATILAATPFATSAQDAGTIVYGNDDAPIGTVESNADGIVTVDTGKHKAPLPANLLAEREIGWTVNATQAQINGMMDQQVAAQAAAQAEAEAKAKAEAEAKLAAALVVGAPVMTNDSQSLGMVDQINGENVVVKTEAASLVTLTRDFFAVDEAGQLLALASLEQIMAAVQGG